MAESVEQSLVSGAGPDRPRQAVRLRDVTRTLVADVLRRGVPTALSGVEGRNAALANRLESEES